MRIALAHINHIPGDIDGNLKTILDIYYKASDEKCDIVVYPELAITGYTPKDLLNYNYIVEQNLKALEKLTYQVKDTACVIGYVDRNEKGWGRPLKNSAAFIYNGKIIQKVHKKSILFFDLFTECRYFEPDTNPPGVIDFKGKKILITICADIWHDTELLLHPRICPISPLETNEKYNLIINISASPYVYGKIEKKVKILKKISQKTSSDILYVNICGANDQVVFDGTSFFITPDGKLLSSTPFSEGITIVDTEKPNETQITEDISFIEKAIIFGIKDFFKKQNLKKAIIGLSGGIDSAIVTYLATKALGNENVLCLIMPSKFTSKDSIEDAKKLCERLSVRHEIIPINDLYETYIKNLKLDESEIDITLQNIQSRIRANILMAYSNRYNYVVLNTSNKSEIAMGYSTMYGDSCGALAPIGDLLKTQIYELAEYINTKNTIIPKSIINRPPTAELKPDQKDEDELGPYKTIDRIIKLYIDEQKDPKDIIKEVGEKEFVISVIKRIESFEYKRKQMPPVIKISPRSFDADRDMPIVKKANI